MSRFLFMGEQEDPEFDVIEARGNTRIYDGTKRDEFACPCCGTPTDGSYCLACEVFECGERDVGAPDVCLVPKGVTVHREQHAAHYPYASPGGHDLIWVEVSVAPGWKYNRNGEPDTRPAGLPRDFGYHSGCSRDGTTQIFRYTRIAQLSPGRCGRCP